MSEPLMISMLTNIQSDVTDLRRKIDDMLRIEGEHKMTQQTVHRLEGEITSLEGRIKTMEDKGPVTGLATKIILGMCGVLIFSVMIALFALVVRGPQVEQHGHLAPTSYETER